MFSAVTKATKSSQLPAESIPGDLAFLLKVDTRPECVSVLSHMIWHVWVCISHTISQMSVMSDVWAWCHRLLCSGMFQTPKEDDSKVPLRRFSKTPVLIIISTSQVTYLLQTKILRGDCESFNKSHSNCNETGVVVTLRWQVDSNQYSWMLLDEISKSWSQNKPRFMTFTTKRKCS